MQTYTSPKKPAPQDWHPADVVAAVRKAGSSIRRLSIENGFAEGSLRVALLRQWPHAEEIIAGALARHPRELWPSRYESNGRPKRKRLDIPFARGSGRPQKGHFGGKHNSQGRAVNGYAGGSK